VSVEEAAKSGVGMKLVIRNIGLLLSGDLERPILEADTVVVSDGLIRAIGKEKEGLGKGEDSTAGKRRRLWTRMPPPLCLV